MTKARTQAKEVGTEQVAEVRAFDYKDPSTLAKYVTERGRIIPRSRSGLTAKEQRHLARSVKRARMIALMPFAG